MKNLLLLAIVLGAMSSCAKEDEFHLTGNAQGTTFNIRYHGQHAQDFSKEVEIVLEEMDKSLSLWREDSFISKVNAMDGTKIPVPADDRFFIDVLLLSRKIHQQSNGHFDPSIYPLIKAWGFGTKDWNNEIPDVASLKEQCGFGVYDAYVANVGPERLFIKSPGRQFDFNGIAQGYTVDAIGRMLRLNNVNDFMVELGGEVLTAGKRKDGTDWRIAIDKPIDGPREAEIVVDITDKALATSGSYRKFYEKDGKKYSHTIDPYTGSPVKHQMLSITVVMNGCGRADAFATAFMSMGPEKTKEMVARHKEWNAEIYMIYEEEGQMKTYGTGRFQDA